MELFMALIPFLVAGFMCAVLSRFTGAAITMLLMPYTLYLGAKPIELIAFMLTFIVYNNFTLETEAARLSTKELIFFKGWKGIATAVLTLLLLFIQPAIAVGLFVSAFMLELGGKVYKDLPIDKRPELATLFKHMGLSTLFSIAGVLIISAIFVQGRWADMMSNYYYLLAGVGVLLYTAFAGHAGAHRDAFRGSWSLILAALHGLLGLFGIEGSAYIKGLRRSYSSRLDGMIGVITMVAAFFSLMTVFALHAQFSFPALIAAIGSALAIRIFGTYEFNNRGGFSYAAMGLLVLAVLCLYLVQPVPVGFDYIEQLLGK